MISQARRGTHMPKGLEHGRLCSHELAALTPWFALLTCTACNSLPCKDGELLCDAMGRACAAETNSRATSALFTCQSSPATIAEGHDYRLVLHPMRYGPSTGHCTRCESRAPARHSLGRGVRELSSRLAEVCALLLRRPHASHVYAHCRSARLQTSKALNRLVRWAHAHGLLTVPCSVSLAPDKQRALMALGIYPCSPALGLLTLSACARRVTRSNE